MCNSKKIKYLSFFLKPYQMGLFGVARVSHVQHLRRPLLRQLGLDRPLAWSSALSPGEMFSNLTLDNSQYDMKYFQNVFQSNLIDNSQYDMLESADRADLQPVTELYGGKRHCRKVSITKTNKCVKRSNDNDLSWAGRCPMTLATPRTSLGRG